MSKTTQITIPLSSLPQGAFGPFASGGLPTTLVGYVIDFTNDVTWPASGDVISILIEVSTDNGVSWQFDASLTLSGGQWTNRQSQPINTASWNVTIPSSATTRRIRISGNVLQACKLGATVSSV